MDLSPLDLKIVFDSSRAYLVKLLDQMGRCLKENKPQEALESFKLYTEQLMKDYQNRIKAKKMALEALNADGSEISSQESHSLETVAIEEWKKIDMPDVLEFDLGKHWPFPDHLKAYVDKVMAILPSDSDALKLTYRQLMPLKTQEKNTQYRRIVIRDMIRWILQERIFQPLSRSNLDDDIRRTVEIKV